jgi:hypothetical protein
LLITPLRLYERGKNAKERPMTDQPALPPAAQRALAEAEARRTAASPLALAPELGGRKGPEPVRYGDWERKGIAVDF